MKSKFNLRNNKGVTLVALVVTIVILFILAGVSMSLTIGDNGIISRTQDAKEQHQKSARKELEDMDKLVRMADREVRNTQKLPILDKSLFNNEFKMEKVSDIIKFHL